MTNQKEREREVLIRYYCRPSVSEIRKEKAQANQDGQIDHRRGTHRFGRSMRECSAKGMAAVRRSHARTHARTETAVPRQKWGCWWVPQKGDLI